MSENDIFGPIELESSGGSGDAAATDVRPRIPEPPPVRLIAVDDVWLVATVGLQGALDAFYVALLGFEREGDLIEPSAEIEPLLGGDRTGPTAPPLALGLRNHEKGSPIQAAPENRPPNHLPGPVYRSENFRLRFVVVEEPLERDTLRPMRIEVPSLAAAEAKLIDAELSFTRQRGLAPGHESLLLLDPAGNWIEITQMARIG